MALSVVVEICARVGTEVGLENHATSRKIERGEGAGPREGGEQRHTYIM